MAVRGLFSRLSFSARKVLDVGGAYVSPAVWLPWTALVLRACVLLQAQLAIGGGGGEKGWGWNLQLGNTLRSEASSGGGWVR